MQGFQIEAEITNRSKGDYKPGQRFGIGAEITNRCRTLNASTIYHIKKEVSQS